MKPARWGRRSFLVFWFLVFGFLIVSYPGLSSAVAMANYVDCHGDIRTERPNTGLSLEALRMSLIGSPVSPTRRSDLNHLRLAHVWRKGRFNTSLTRQVVE